MVHPNAWYSVFWIVLGIFVLFLECMTGPEIQFPIIYAVPVFLASRYRNVRWGVGLAVALPLLRMEANLLWGEQTFSLLLIVNVLIRMAVLAALAVAVDRIMMLTREIKVLRGILPVCSFCKKIRTDSGEWEQMEAYISARSEAEFSHGFCPDCAEKHYGKYLKKGKSARK